MLLRRISRSRIWRDFLNTMAAFLGLSALFFFCGSIFRVSPYPAGDSGVQSIDLDLTLSLEHQKEPVLQYREDGATSVGVQRHNRALQFMDAKKFGKDSPESSETVKTGDISHANSEKHKPNALEFEQEIKLNDKRTKDIAAAKDPEATFYIDDAESPQSHKHPHRGDSAKGVNSKKHHKNAENSARHEFHFTENKDDQLENVLSLRSQAQTSAESGDKITTEIPIKRLPKAIIIGAKKAGTRALLEFLRIHPNVEGTGPEPHFFDRNYEKGLKWYRELMPKTFQHQITIEKTPGYFVTKDASRRIFEMDPAIKLILVVRDPVTRAISDYCQAASKHPMRPFEEMALLDERMGLVNTSWGAIKIGVYAKHMEHWLQVFNLDQIHLVDGQKLIEEPARELAKVETFLGLPKFIKDSHFYLRGFKGTFPCLIRDGKPHCLDEKTKGRDHPVVKESVLKRLRDFYRPFNAKFYQMIGRNYEWS